jgi:hypothetical protein
MSSNVFENSNGLGIIIDLEVGKTRHSKCPSNATPSMWLLDSVCMSTR